MNCQDKDLCQRQEALTQPLHKIVPDLPPDLARVVNASPELPEHIRKAVLALVGTAGG
jgi:hypothetical protein